MKYLVSYNPSRKNTFLLHDQFSINLAEQRPYRASVSAGILRAWSCKPTHAYAAVSGLIRSLWAVRLTPKVYTHDCITHFHRLTANRSQFGKKGRNIEASLPSLQSVRMEPAPDLSLSKRRLEVFRQIKHARYFLDFPTVILCRRNPLLRNK